MYFDISSIPKYFPYFLPAAWMTLKISVLGIALGSGLGLAIVKQVVLKHGGALRGGCVVQRQAGRAVRLAGHLRLPGLADPEQARALDLP